MGLFGGRSKPKSRKIRSDQGTEKPSSRPRRRRLDEEQPEDAPKPDIDELRQRRAEYYSVPPATRRRVSSSTPALSSTKRSTVSSSRSISDRQRTRKRRHKAESHGSDSREDRTPSRTEEYVYGPRPKPSSDTSSRVEGVRLSRSTKTTSKRSSSPRRRTLPTLYESEITPDDSISQVGERIASESDPSPSSLRPSIKRSKTTSAKLPIISETLEDASSSLSKKSPRPLSSLGSISRRHSTTSVLSPPKLTECLTCGSDDVPSTQSAKLACGHRMCHECLKRIFEMSVKDPQHMPPKCCQDDHIPLRHVDKLFDVKFKKLWNTKYQEYHTKNRIYCPAPKCGEWIKPTHIHTSQGRKYAQCPRCKTKVCMLCNNKLHKSSDCPEDPEIAKLVKQAKEQGWQRCYSCNAMVERREGCNHMTCRCKAEFCIVCGSKWKTCDCPWFNYSNLPNPDRLNDMRVPEPIQIIWRRFMDLEADQAHLRRQPPVPVRDDVRAPPEPLRDNRRRPDVTYQEELDQRRRQERLDADLARRLQLASLLDPDDAGPARNRHRAEEVFGNVVGNFMNDDFVQNAANVIMNTFGDANLGRRGERLSVRRRRSTREEDPGLAPNFLGDESVLGVGSSTRRRASPR